MPTRQRSGTTTVEFALVAIPLTMLIIGTIALAMWIWTWQVLAAAAGDAARCAGINATSCASVATSTTATATYAISAASSRGLSGLTTSNVAITTGTAAQTACNSTTASVVRVAISYTYSAALVIPAPGTITGAACFPLTSS